jgi:hypothetical protein
VEALATAYVERLQELVTGFERALQGLSVDALDWSPGPEMNSLTVLATHTIAAVRYLIGDLIADDPSGRVRAEEFRTVGRSAEELGQGFAAVSAYAQGVVGKLTMDDLARESFSPQHERNVTVAWCLLRALDHLAEHMAHAQLTRLLWEQRGKNV